MLQNNSFKKFVQHSNNNEISVKFTEFVVHKIIQVYLMTKYEIDILYWQDNTSNNRNKFTFMVLVKKARLTYLIVKDIKSRKS